MKTKILFNFLIIILVVISSSAYVLADTSLSVEPTNSLVSYNDEFLINVDIDTHDSIAGATLDVNFDPTVLEAVSMAEGGFLSQNGVAAFDLGNSIDNTAGKVKFNMFASTPLKGFNGTGHLVNITFKAIKKNDSSNIEIDNILLGDWKGAQVNPSTVNNGTVSVSATEYILINEFLPHSSGQEWIEIYNNDSRSIDIGNWKINDSANTIVNIGEGNILEANELTIFYVSNKLNNGGDTIKLINDEGTVISEYTYALDPGTDVSIGRKRDGLDEWINFTTPTPNAPNNRLPTGDIDTQLIAEDDFGYFIVTNNITDPDNDPLTFTVVDENANKVDCNVKNDTNVTLTPAENYNGIANCTIRVDDTFGTVDKLFYIDVNSINDAPNISTVPNKIATEDVDLILNMTPYINDIDNDKSELIITENSNYATVNNQIITFNYPNGISEEDVTITVSDGELSDSQNITVAVISENDAPTISGVPDQTATEDVDLILNVAPYIHDVDNETSRLIITENSNYATVNNQIITFNYPNGISEEDVTITVSDGELSDSQNITVAVANTNDDPILSEIEDKTAIESLPLTFNLTAADEDPTNDTLTFSTNASIGNFKLNSTTGLVTFTPAFADVGVYNIWFKVTDGNTGQDNETIILTVKSALEINDLDITIDGTDFDNLNDGAIINAMPGNQIEVNIELKNMINIDIRGIIVNGTIDTDLGLMKQSSLIPNLPAQNTHAINLQFNLPNVIGEKLYPLVIKSSGEDENHIIRNVQRTIFIGVTQEGNDVILENLNLIPNKVACVKDATLNFNITNRGKFDQNSGNKIQITNEQLGINIEDIFTVPKESSIAKSYPLAIVTDKTGTFPIKLNVTWFYVSSIINTVDLEVENCINIPDKPILEDSGFNDNLIDLHNFTNDLNVDLSSLNYAIVSQPNPSIVECTLDSNRFIDCTTQPDQNGHSDITVNVTGSTTSSDTFRITVLAVNDPPVITSLPDETFNEGETKEAFDLDNFVTDPDNTNDKLNWSWEGNEQIIVSVNSNKVVTFGTKDENFFGSGTIAFTVKDPAGLNDTDTITVTVNQLFDDLPFINSSSPDFNPLIGDNVNQELSVSVVNPDNIDLTIKWLVDGVEEGTGNTFIFNEPASGTYEVEASVENTSETFDTKIWSVQVSKVPITTFDGTIKDVDETNVGNFANLTIQNSFGKIDFGDQTLDLSSVVDVDRHVRIEEGVVGIDSSNLPALNKPATITMFGLLFEETPVIFYNAGFSLSGNSVCPSSICSNINYNASTGTLTFDVTHFSMFWVPVSNHAPVITSSPVTTAFTNTLYAYDVDATDQDNDTLAYSLITKPSGMSIDPSGLISWTPTNITTEDVTVKAVDGNGGSDMQSFTINVKEPPKLIISNLDAKITAKDGTKTDKNLKDGDTISREAEPGSDVEFKVKVKNLFTNEEDVDIEDIGVTITIKDIDDGDDLDEDSKEFDLNAKDDKTVTLDFKVPIEVDEDTYDVEIHVEGEGTNGKIQEVDWTVFLKVKKERHDIQINRLNINPETVSCTRTATLTTEIINLGGDDEEEAALEILSPELGINFRQESIELQEGTEDNTYDKTLTIKVPDDQEAGAYPITVNTYFDNDNLDDSKTVELNVQDCERVAKEEEVVKEKPKTTEVIKPPVVTEKKPPVTKVSFTESDTYIILLAVAFILLTGIVIFAAGAAIMTFRRK